MDMIKFGRANSGRDTGKNRELRVVKEEEDGLASAGKKLEVRKIGREEEEEEIEVVVAGISSAFVTLKQPHFTVARCIVH